jgi:hypothetical protein
MTKRRDDVIPEPPGGRAAERLQMFVSARAPKPDVPVARAVKKVRQVRKPKARRSKA